jgi:hypothetical protein
MEIEIYSNQPNNNANKLNLTSTVVLVKLSFFLLKY